MQSTRAQMACPQTTTKCSYSPQPNEIIIIIIINYYYFI